MTRMEALAGLSAVLAVTFAAACSAPDLGDRSVPDGETPGGPSSERAQGFPAAGRLDYQLGTAYGEPGEFDVVGRDASAEPLEGAYNVCYVNGFQTQPGSLPQWEAEAPEALLRDGAGEPVMDPDWPDEAILDPSSAEQRAAILAVIGPIVRGCAASGFDAVELDNLDTFTRFEGITQSAGLELARAYVGLGHEVGIAVGQKNAAELARQGRDEVGFDFAVVEECAVYDECGAYREAYGERVLQIEYADTEVEPAELCESADRAPLVVLRDRLLVAPGQAGYVREECR